MEEDIVLSVNVRFLSMQTVNDEWEPAFTGEYFQNNFKSYNFILYSCYRFRCEWDRNYVEKNYHHSRPDTVFG